MTGVEVQRSSMTASRAVIRTRKASTAGVTDVWFCGRDGSPPWAWRVPTVLPRELGIDRPYDGEKWTTMPPRRAVTAAGLRVLRAVKCAVGNIDHCPYGRNWCGKYHPRPVPWGGVTVDDVAAKFPAGEIVLLRFWGATVLGSHRRDAIFLVSPADFRLYEEMTGWSGSVSFKPEAEDRPPPTPSGTVECRDVQRCQRERQRVLRDVLLLRGAPHEPSQDPFRPGSFQGEGRLHDQAMQQDQGRG